MNAARVREKIAFTILGLITLLIVLPIILTIFYVVKNGAGAVSWEFLTQSPRHGMREGGIFPAIIGTIVLIIGTMLFSLPLGILSAIYLVEYAKDNLFTRLIKLSVVNLSGIPSIVYGLFGFTLFVVFLNFGTSILAWADRRWTIMSLPVIITATTKRRWNRCLFHIQGNQSCHSVGLTNGRRFGYCVLPLLDTGKIPTGTVFKLEQGRGRDSPDIVNSRRHFTCLACLFIRFSTAYGTAVSFVCYINSGS